MRLDHVVLKVDDLEQAIERYSKLGFTVVRGGEHKNFGSHNALIAFSDGSYIELIAFLKPLPQQSRTEKMRELQEVGRSRLIARVTPWSMVSEGLLDFAMLPTTEEENFEQLKQRQLDIEGPMPMERKRPDGQEISWEMGFPYQEDLPFLIRDITPRNLRLPEENTHPLGVSGISKLVMVVRDLNASSARYEKLLNIAPLDYTDQTLLKGNCKAFPCGSTKIILLEPEETNVILKKHLEERGESVWSLELASDDKTKRETFVLKQLQEMRITLA